MTISNPNQADADGDGIGNACDISNNIDTDGDGVANATDNCSAIANTNQTDSDNDGIGNACDSCPNDPNNDSDADGICGNLDNCPNVSNPSQADADADGIGDACSVAAVGIGTLRLIWWDSDTDPAHIPTGEDWAGWTIRRGDSLIATGYGPDTSDGIDDVPVPVSTLPYTVIVDWYYAPDDWLDQSVFQNVYVTTPGQDIRLNY